MAQLYAKYEAANRARKSWWTIEDRLLPFVAALGDREVMSLRLIDWSDYRAERDRVEIPTGKPGRRYGAHTINLELQAVKTMLNAAVAQGRIPHNPLVLAKCVRTKSARATAPREDDVTALLAKADARMRVVVLCAADAGMRRSEIARLRWDWIEREAGRINLPAWACKGNKARTVPATGRMLEAIDQMPRSLRSPYVLTNERTDGPYRIDVLSAWFRQLADAAGIEATPGDVRVRLHDVRHGWASNAARRGVRIEIVSKILGHSSLNQTRTYVQTADDDLTSARETFEAGILRDQRRGPKRAPDAPAAAAGSDIDGKSKGSRK